MLLPLMQVLLAVALITSNLLRPDPPGDPSWTKPDWQLCLGLNAPASLIAQIALHLRLQWFNPDFPSNIVVDWIVRLPLIWLLWYLVSIEIGGKGRSVLTAETRIPRVADVFAIALGVIVGAQGLYGTRHFPPSYARLVAAPYLIWAIVLIGFYGHDLWLFFAGKHELVNR